MGLARCRRCTYGWMVRDDDAASCIVCGHVEYALADREAAQAQADDLNARALGRPWRSSSRKGLK